MSNEELDRECAELVELVREQSEAKLGKRWRCPRGLRRRAVEYAEACQDQGESALVIARRLGLVESTLCRWLRKERARQGAIVPAMRPVNIVDPAPGVESEVGGLRLVTPAGVVVEGLDLEGVAYLLRILP